MSLPTADGLFDERLQSVYRRSDRVFAWLMGAQWLLGVVLAVTVSPYTWAGRLHTVHVHLYSAVFLGGALSIPVLLLTWLKPGWVGTRHVVAISQMLWSALLIHLSGGRIETHFHIFGSLAFLAFYRDWRVLVTATVVIAADHLARGVFSPESVYGVANPEWWRFAEHAGWVVFEDIVLFMGIAQNRSEMRTLALQQTQLGAIHLTVEQKVIERTWELHKSREQYRALLETTRTIPWTMGAGAFDFSYVGPQAATLLGVPADAWLATGFLKSRAHPDDFNTAAGELTKAIAGGLDIELELRLRKDDQTWAWVRAIVSSAGSEGLRGVFLDVTEKRRLESELAQAQKLESVGRLASGIAHEINTPVQFVSDNLSFLRDAMNDLMPLLTGYTAMRTSLSQGVTPSSASLETLEALELRADLAYLNLELPRAVSESLEGLRRVSTIVRSVKTFAHPEGGQMVMADLNEALSSTLTIARNEYRYVADIETQLSPVPQLVCHIGELNQVFLNLLVNASHAISDLHAKTGTRGVIKVKTRCEGDVVAVSICDNGGGIPPAIQHRIFEPFFTTKAVGKGTGQGLAMSRSIVDKHGGTLSFESEPGLGTTFTLRLPLAGQARKAA